MSGAAQVIKVPMDDFTEVEFETSCGGIAKVQCTGHWIEITVGDVVLNIDVDAEPMTMMKNYEYMGEI